MYNSMYKYKLPGTRTRAPWIGGWTCRRRQVVLSRQRWRLKMVPWSSLLSSVGEYWIEHFALVFFCLLGITQFWIKLANVILSTFRTLKSHACTANSSLFVEQVTIHRWITEECLCVRLQPTSFLLISLWPPWVLTNRTSKESSHGANWLQPWRQMVQMKFW